MGSEKEDKQCSATTNNQLQQGVVTLRGQLRQFNSPPHTDSTRGKGFLLPFPHPRGKLLRWGLYISGLLQIPEVTLASMGTFPKERGVTNMTF